MPKKMKAFTDTPEIVTIMAINPRMYETQYGFEILDTLHNFFPEIMYDAQLFPSNTFQWMRHRVSTLFPDVFVRQQAMYRMYNAHTRAQAMDEWRNYQSQAQSQANTYSNIWTQGAPSPIPNNTPNRPLNTSMPTYASVAARQATGPVAAATAAAGAPGRTAPSTPQNQPIHRQPDAPVRQRMAHPTPPFVTSSSLNITDPMADIITEMLRQPRSQFLAGDQMLLNMFATLGPDIIYEDVIVAPTPQQINEGSAIVNLPSVPEGTNCAICQERGESQEWRRIYCNHYFHNACISTWYQRSTECPVCRADIRDAAMRTMAAQAQGSEPMSDSKEDN